MEHHLQRRQVDHGYCESQLERDSPQKQPVGEDPVRAAKAVPTWQAVIPAKVIAVAARYEVCSGLPAPVGSPGDHPEE